MNWGEIIQYALFAASVAAMTAGLVFVLAGAIGVIRLPDFYTRMHSAGVTDTLGAELIVLGLVLQAHDWQTVAKLALVGLLLFLTSPTATHAIANAAHRAGHKPHLSRFRPPHPSEAGKPAGKGTS
ncbi:monovalent cation/H(+) antiporter subunit G [Maricaulis sp.]|jgi:multicomponent Na+:H+ antiporter subunit G|uniref:monovalent cation/H(+) antiporter subunit G n=1 Tax=Maricaulis sp. TaxID=1486257 RepID=UPI00260B8257|nr:monovalent cation/H(+) antiporter subunit G [Maricaulis sp.]